MVLWLTPDPVKPNTLIGIRVGTRHRPGSMAHRLTVSCENARFMQAVRRKPAIRLPRDGGLDLVCQAVTAQFIIEVGERLAVRQGFEPFQGY